MGLRCKSSSGKAFAFKLLREDASTYRSEGLDRAVLRKEAASAVPSLFELSERAFPTVHLPSRGFETFKLLSDSNANNLSPPWCH